MNNHFPWLQEILAHVHPSAHPTLPVSPLAVLWEAPLPVESLTDPKSALHPTSLLLFSLSPRSPPKTRMALGESQRAERQRPLSHPVLAFLLYNTSVF